MARRGPGAGGLRRAPAAGRRGLWRAGTTGRRCRAGTMKSEEAVDCASSRHNVCGKYLRNERNASNLSKDDLIDMQGTVVAVHSGGLYRVQCDAGHEVLAQLSGRMRRFRIKVVPGDRVTVGVSPVRSSPGHHHLPRSLARTVLNSNTTPIVATGAREDGGPRRWTLASRHPPTTASRHTADAGARADVCDTTPVPFTAFGLDPRLLEGIRDLGFSETRPIQSAVIPLAMSGAMSSRAPKRARARPARSSCRSCSEC